MDNWICVGVESTGFWPQSETVVEFEGHKVILRVETESLAPSIAFNCGAAKMSYESAMELIQRLMSSLAWADGVGIRPIMWAGGGFPIGIGKGGQRRRVAHRYDAAYLPNPSGEKARLALALYRDALSLNNSSYKLLGLSRILNIMGKARVQKDWINANLGKIKTTEAIEVINLLKKKSNN